MNEFEKIFNEIRTSEKNEDWEMCIKLCRKLVLSTDQTHFEEWFKSRFELANFLLESKYNQLECIEEAILVLYSLLERISRKEYPEKYATIHLCLGFAHDRRLKGDKTTNLKTVLEHYRQTLTVFTREDYPKEWAMTIAGIGLAYSEIKEANERENILQAIDYYEETLKVYTKSDYPEDHKDSLQELVRLQGRLKKL